MSNAANNAQKLSDLREVMTKKGVGAYLVPRTDEYLNEFMAPYAERLGWLTGFTGSAGLAVITEDKAVVMSDGRYTIQLTHEVDQSLYSLENSQVMEAVDWMKDNLNPEIIVGYDPRLHTPHFIQKLENADIKTKAVHGNLIDEIWVDQPAKPMALLSLFPDEIAGQSAADKIKRVQENMDGDAVLITMLDSIAWLLNIRGGDVSHIPVALSTIIIPKEGRAQFFIEDKKITSAVRDALDEVVEFIEPEKITEYLSNTGNQKITFDSKRSTVFYQEVLSQANAVINDQEDPCVLWRAAKTESEQQAMRDVHVIDGVALAKFLHWFDQEAVKGNLDELSVEEKLQEFRTEDKAFQEPSFATIAGYGSNGAIVHYRASKATNKRIKADNLLLLDSGGQYHYGTTDITRTIAVGMPSEEMIKANTLVLKGHIALAMAVFDDKINGKKLDALARKFLQAEGWDYAHGTGHGVGCYLSVHEEAPSISPRGEKPYQEGMVLSNEPGYYKEGAFGIRIENLIMVQCNAAGQFYFDTITLAPLDKKLIDLTLLDEKEIEWINNYHAKVFEKISPRLDGDVKDWLEKATAPL